MKIIKRIVDAVETLRAGNKIEVHGDCIVSRVLFRVTSLKVQDIRRIDVYPVLSLADEIEVQLTATVTLRFTDADRGFQEVVNSLNFDRLFGADWYAQAEQGEALAYVGSIEFGADQ